MKAATVLPLLLLQKPRGTFRPKDFAVILDRRLAQWKRGEIDALVREGRVLQNELRNTRTRKSDMQDEHVPRIFNRLMLQGKVKAALRWIMETSSFKSKGVLPLTSTVDSSGHTVFQVLQEKHPGAQGLNPDAVISHEDADAIARPFHPVLYERLTGDQIRSAALRTEGAAGPSGLDASIGGDYVQRSKSRQRAYATQSPLSLVDSLHSMSTQQVCLLLLPVDLCRLTRIQAFALLAFVRPSGG